MSSHPDISTARRATLSRRIRLVVLLTISYNLVEAVVALMAGSLANSSALIGFGLDSVVEVSSAAAVAWQFASPHPQNREKATLRIIAVSFFALAAFVSYDAVTTLAQGQAVRHSSVGIALAMLSLAVMPALSLFQRRTGQELGSHSAVADSKQTLLCTYMSAALLIGLVANSAAGWWWADPVAALVIAGLALREGLNARRGDACCATGTLSLHQDDSSEVCDSGCPCP